MLTDSNDHAVCACVTRRCRTVLEHFSRRTGMFEAGALTVILAAAGCASLPGGEHQFEPVPQASVGVEELEPAATPSMTDLLRAAGDAFQEANAAQERGDQETALRKYTQMLELLIQANPDPTVFYDLRAELGDVLKSASQQARLYDRMRGIQNGAEGSGGGITGDISIEFPLHERILKEIEEIQQLYPKNFQAGLNRSTKYVPELQEEFAQAGLPKDLVWLAMVESQFSEKISSPAGAGGMWQFMRATGKRYNLRIDNEVDERFDWEKCTQAAIAYLKTLYEMFDSWPLAISAYNMGEYGLDRAMASNGGERDLWKLIETPPASDRIRLETKKFYPKLLASIIVAGSPESYGFKVDTMSPEPCVPVPTNGSYSLAELDKAVGLPSGTLARLNPHLIRGATPQSSYMVKVPVETRDKMVAALKSIPQVRYASISSSGGGPGGTHIVKRGETISCIATRYHVSQRDLMRTNKIMFAHRLQTGRKLIIPGGTGGGSSEVAAPEPASSSKSKSEPAATKSATESKPEPVASNSSRRVYKVKRGDSLFEIAKAQKVSMTDLQEWNRLDKRGRIVVGQNLYVSEPGNKFEEASESSPETGVKNVHIVRAGEYPAKVAKNYNVSLEDLLHWNDLSKTSTIRVGDRLVIYQGETAQPSAAKVESAPAAPAEEAAPASSAKEKEEVVVAAAASPAPVPAAAPAQTHKVAKGEVASTIAAKYNIKTSDLLAWNGLTAKSVIRVGDELVVSGKSATAASAQPAKDSKPAAGPEKIIHTVTKGQNPTVIARRYGVQLSTLFEWNGWTKAPVLKVGDKVIIYKEK